MQQLPKVIPILIATVALNFTLVFGLQAWLMLTSPIGGLEQPAFARVVYSLGQTAGLDPGQHIQLAAVFAVVNLVIAVLFALHLASRVGALFGGRISHDALDVGLIMVVASTLLVATPAMLQGASDILVQERLPLWLVGLAATLSMIERLPETEHARRPGYWERAMSRLLTLRGKPDTVVSPVMRNNVPSVRWNELRSEAGMVMRPVPVRSFRD